MKEIVAASDANVVVRQVPEKPRMWARIPKRADTAAATAAARYRECQLGDRRMGQAATLTGGVKDEHVGQPLDDGVRHLFCQVDASETIESEELFEICATGARVTTRLYAPSRLALTQIVAKRGFATLLRCTDSPRAQCNLVVGYIRP